MLERVCRRGRRVHLPHEVGGLELGLGLGLTLTLTLTLALALALALALTCPTRPSSR